MYNCSQTCYSLYFLLPREEHRGHNVKAALKQSRCRGPQIMGTRFPPQYEIHGIDSWDWTHHGDNIDTPWWKYWRIFVDRTTKLYGVCFNIKTILGCRNSQYRDKMVVRRHIFIMGIPILARWHLYTESCPSALGMVYYPMLSVDSHFWLVNNREI